MHVGVFRHNDFQVFLLSENVSIFFQVHSSPPCKAGPEQLTVQEVLHSCVYWAGYPAKGQENIFFPLLCLNCRKPLGPCVHLETLVVPAMETKEEGQVACWQ